MQQQELFPLSETFQKEKPTKITEKQEQDLYLKLANEIISKNWSDSKPEVIIRDLKELSRYDTAFEMGKKLDGLFSKGSYDIDSDFIEWLDWFDYYFREIHEQNIKNWVIANKIKPKLPIGTRLIISKPFSRTPDLQEDKTIFINGYHEEVAKYHVSATKGSTRNFAVDYDEIENNTTIQ